MIHGWRCVIAAASGLSDRVKETAKVACHLFFGILALTVDQLLRLGT